MADNSVFSGVLNAIKGNRKAPNPSTVAGTMGPAQAMPQLDPTKGVESMQQDFLDWQVHKMSHDLYTRTVYFDTDRISAYQDFRAMDNSPEIAAALNIMRDECLTRGENGDILEIYSENDRVKNVLEDLFRNVLQIEFNLRLWIRDLIKYGDYMVYLTIDKDVGIYDFQTLPAEETHREEGYDGTTNSVRFRWETTGDYFEEWQIAHFRLLEDTKKLPYGRCLKYDTYIETEDGVKFIKDIKKGDSVFSFNTETHKKEKTKVLDVVHSGKKEIFKIRTKHHEIETSEEHKILVCDNDEFVYKNVCDLNVKDLLVVDKNVSTNNKIKINKSFDDSKNFNGYRNDIDLIPDYVDEEFAKLFGFMLGDGWLAKNSVDIALGVDDEINQKYITLLEKFSGKEIKFIKPANKKGILEFSQARVNSKMLNEVFKNNGFSGNVYNKRLPKWIFTASKEIQKSLIEGIMDADGSKNIDKWDCIRYSLELANEYLIKDVKTLLQRLGIKVGKICSRDREVTKIWGDSFKTKRSYYIYFFNSEISQIKKYDIKKRNDDNFIITPLISIEKQEIEEDVFDIYVENDNHNFYANGIVVHNSMLDPARKLWKQLQLAEDAMLVYRITRAPERRVFYIEVGNLPDADVKGYVSKVQMALKKQPIVDQRTGNMNYKFDPKNVTEDYYIPIRGDKSSKIETLPGACLSLDTKIDLLDGRSLELKDIIKEFEEGNELWSYSINPETGEIVPGVISWAGVTRKNTQVLKITLDNGEEIICTPDHKFPTRINGEKEAKDLFVGESLWSFNKKFKSVAKNDKKRNDYEMIFDHSKNNWEYTHRIIANYFKNINEHEEFIYNEKYLNEDKNTIHHKNFNRYCNNPKNLCFMNNNDHYEFHSDNIEKWSKLGVDAWLEKFDNDEEFKKDVIDRLDNIRKKYYANRSVDKKTSHNNSIKNGIENYFNNLSDEEREVRTNISKINFKEGSNKLQELLKDDEFKKEFYKKTSKSLKISQNKLEFKERQSRYASSQWETTNLREVIKEKQEYKYSDELLKFIVELYKKGKVDSVAILREINNDNSWFIREFSKLNEGNKQMKKMSNFTHNNLCKMLKEFGYENFRDFKEKVECYNHKIVSIEFLEEKMDTGTITIDGNEKYHNFHNFALSCGVFTKNSNLGEIQDIEYLQNKLFAAIQVPKSYLNYSEALPGGSTLSQTDLRFSRTINSIQEAVLLELRRVANVHLYFLGFEDALDNFKITLTNPSTQQELLKLETMKARIEVFKELFSAEATSPTSYTWAMENILGFSKYEIKHILKQKKVEKKLFAEIESAVETYKKIGLFDELDEKFEDPEAAARLAAAGPEGEEGGDMSAGGGGFGGAGDAGAGMDFGDTGGDMGADAGAEAGGEVGAPEAGAEELAESKLLKILKESDKRSVNLIDQLLEEEVEKPKKESGIIKSSNKVRRDTKNLMEKIQIKLDGVDVNIILKERKKLQRMWVVDFLRIMNLC